MEENTAEYNHIRIETNEKAWSMSIFVSLVTVNHFDVLLMR